MLVRGTARANEGSIVATQVIQKPGNTPIDFRVVYENADIDPSAVYTVQAGIVDGDNVWTTAKGTKVLTNGAPTSGIALTLAYQPDLVKGEVSGSITGQGIQLSATAYSIAILIEPSTGESLGMDVNPTDGKIPTPFAVPFSLDSIDQAKTYVVTGELVDGATTWENSTGVPVITNGNAISDVQVVVAQVVAPSPSPEPSPSESGRGDVTPAILLMIVALIVGAIGLLLWSRSRRQPPTAGDPAAAARASPGPRPLQPSPRRPKSRLSLHRRRRRRRSLSRRPPRKARDPRPDPGGRPWVSLGSSARRVLRGPAPARARAFRGRVARASARRRRRAGERRAGGRPARGRPRRSRPG